MKKLSGTAGKLIFIGVIIGLLSIANAFINSKMKDRERTSDDAKKSIYSAAGGSFNLHDIEIHVPYAHRYTEINTNGVKIPRTEYLDETVKPTSIEYKVDLSTEERKIGIYSAPIFNGTVDIKVKFDLSSIKDSADYTYDTTRSKVLLAVSDKNLVSKPEITYKEKTYTFQYGNDYNITDSKSYYCTIYNNLYSQISLHRSEIELNIKMNIRGAEKFTAYIPAQETTMNINCDWPSPKFSDFSYLPTDYKINEDGFTASWYVPFDVANSTSDIGFYFIDPVDVYKKLERAVKYGFLFIIIPFIVMFLFEIFAAVNLHPVHYLLSGCASVMFFLLLLSISEHLNFTATYIIAALASGILVSLYNGLVTGKIKLGIIMNLMFILLYGYLFFCLKSEDYALLMGSIFAFFVLAFIMFITRKVDWSTLKKSKHTDLIKE